MSQRLLRCERGAVFVQIGIAAFVLMAFNVFVLDYGMMWIGRRQAQNAADAGALAGAVARGYDELNDPPPSGGVTEQSASLMATANLIWQQPGTPVVSYSCPAGITGRCVRVDVDRNVETLFGPILGISTQPVRATATAIAGTGNATPCLRPWAIADRWDDSPSPDGVFNAYAEGPIPPAGTPLSNPDLYTPPSSTQAGQITVSANLGNRLNFDLGGNWASSPITPRLVLPLDLPGGNTYQQNMQDCTGEVLALGKTLPVLTTTVDTTLSIQEDVYDRDFSANYHNYQKRIMDSCAPGCAPISPRLLAIVLYNPDKFQLGRATGAWTSVGCPTNNPCVTVSNIVGLFIHCVPGRPCLGTWPEHGHLLKYPGTQVATPPLLVDDASWLVTTHLVR
jgi:Putative Flp pilus-assembly TadE/G-like